MSVGGLDIASAAAVGKAVADIVKTAKQLGWFEKLQKFFARTNLVLVVGSSGAGKSQLLTAMENILPTAISGYARTQVAETKEMKISTKFFKFIDTPGHEASGHEGVEGGAHRARLNAIRKGFAKDLAGIINVVSFGYHEKVPPPPDDAFDGDGKVPDAFLKRHRDLEIAALKEWTDQFASPKAPPRVLTVVAKADLWWDRQAAVLRHYRSGDYFDGLGHVKKKEHLVVPFSSVFHKFYGKGPTAGSFDDQNRAELRAELLKQLLLSVQKGGD